MLRDQSDESTAAQAVYPPLQNRKPADVAQEANVTICFSPLAAAEVEDAEAADGEVVGR